MSGADHDQMDRMRTHMTNMCTGWDVEQVKSIVDETLHDIVDSAGVRRSRGPDRRPQTVRPRRRRRLGVGRGDRRADRPGAGRDPRDGHPDGRRGRQVHRRGRVLLLRRGQGAGDPGAGRPARATRWNTATPTPTRSPTCRCSRPSATPVVVNPDRGLRKEADRARLARAEFLPAGVPARPNSGTVGRRRRHHRRGGHQRAGRRRA